MKNRAFYYRLGFALQGLASAWKSEASFRFQVLAAIGSFVVFAWLKASPLWWAFWVVAVALVLSAELFNTALEHVIDKLHPNVDPHIKIAKDCAAGAVLVLSLASVAIFAVFLLDHFERLAD